MKKGYLGIDCGSVSLKIALIDEDENLIKSVYLRNKGVIETLKDALKEVESNDYKICGVGTTGSGRNLVGILVGADVIKTEILAHIVSALKYYPDVKTLIDIGGEDSKVITLNNGIMDNFNLNSICSAGTGSFLESIAIRMGIKIEDVGDIALQSKNKVNIDSKCGVFAQSTVVTKLNSGYSKEDILLGVIRALVHNYLTMARGMDLKPPFVYQSATAKNKAIVKVFQEELKNEIIIPEHCDVMGAIGIALITKRDNPKSTKFNGFEIKNREYTTKNFTAKGCDNNCEITLIYQGKNYLGCLGNRCDKCEISDGKNRKEN